MAGGSGSRTLEAAPAGHRHELVIQTPSTKIDPSGPHGHDQLDNPEGIARKLVAPGKGILAADESSGTIEKRLKSISVPSTEENRRAYREILFTTKGAGEFISGVILFDETIRQKSRNGRGFVEVLEQQGIVPGIKVDKGAKAMANFPGEKITEGLDGLRERLG